MATVHTEGLPLMCYPNLCKREYSRLGVQVYATFAAIEKRFSCSTTAASVAAGMTAIMPDLITRQSVSTTMLQKWKLLVNSSLPEGALLG